MSKNGSLTADIALLLSIGVVLGLAYNALGLREANGWGIAWKGVAPTDTLGAEVQPVESDALPAASAYVSDDPLAPAIAPTRAVPVIEDFGRPVEIGLEAVKQLHDADAALFIDAREDWEFAEGHIPGAINLPFEQVINDPARLEKVDQAGKPIVTYCGGGNCEISITVAWELLGVGKTHIAVYMGGFPEWKEAGYAVEEKAAGS